MSIPALSQRTHTRRRLLAVLVACLTLVFVAPGTAGADEVDDLNAKADRIARQLMDLDARISQIGEQFNQSQVRRGELAKSKADIQQRSRVARLELVARRADAARYAMSAYVGIDQGETLSMALDGRQWDLSRRTGYASIRIGDRDQLVDDLQAAQTTNNDLLASLAAANRAEKKIADDLTRQQAEATRLVAEAERVQAGVQGELAQAVARRQAALAAAQASTSAPSGVAGGLAGSAQGSVPTQGNASVTTRPGQPSTSTSTGPGTPTTTATTTPAAPPTTRPPVTTPPPVAPPIAPPVTPPSNGGAGQTVVNAAISQLGVAYSWGGGTASGPSMGFGPGAGIVGFDCSGLVLYAWAQVGVSLPHSAQMQYNMSAKVALNQLQPGDLVFYGSSASSIDHVGIYVGSGQIIHAPNSRSVVQYGPVNLWPGYYAWTGAGRPR